MVKMNKKKNMLSYCFQCQSELYGKPEKGICICGKKISSPKETMITITKKEYDRLKQIERYSELPRSY